MRRCAGILFFVCIFALLFAPVKVGASLPVCGQAGMTTNGVPTRSAGPEAMANWHDGTDRTENGVSITFTQTAQAAAGVHAPDVVANVYQEMDLVFNDAGNTKLGWLNIIGFVSGGVDVGNNKVLDWSKVKLIGFGLTTRNFLNGSEYVGTDIPWGELYVVKGDASDVKFSTGLNYTAVEDSSAVVNFYNCTTHIGPVSTAISGNDTIAAFSVTFDAGIGPKGGAQVPIPANVTIKITHKPDRNIIEYGMALDWSGAKQFQCQENQPLAPGDHYSLVFEERAQVVHGAIAIGGPTNVRTIASFSMTDPTKNDTADLVDNGFVYATWHFTTNYTIAGESTPRQTTRVHFLNARGCSYEGATTPYMSVVFVIFDGFVYGTSTGFSFDPAAIIPWGPGGLSIVWILLIIGIVGAVGAGVAVFLIHRRRAHQPR